MSDTAPRRRRPFRALLKWAGIAVVAIIAIAVIASLGSDDDPAAGDEPTTTAPPADAGDEPATAEPADTEPEAPEPGEPAADVVVDDCEAGDFGDVTAKLTVTNSTDDVASYLITAEAVDEDGNRLVELTAAANSIAAGQSAKVDAMGMTDVDLPAGYTCRVANVERFNY